VDFGRRIMLLGYELDARRASSGGRLTITLFWQAEKALQKDYNVFVHLETDKIYAQSDGLPACWKYPTSLWRDGQIVTDHHALSLPADIPPGKYPLLVGWYNPADDSRLEILDKAGQPIANNYSIAEIEIK
jgi:mannosyltransferase